MTAGWALILAAMIIAVSVYYQSKEQLELEDGVAGGGNKTFERSHEQGMPSPIGNRRKARLREPRIAERPTLEDFKKLVGSLEKPDLKSLSEDFISELVIPDPSLMNPSQKGEFLRIVSLVGDSVHIQATTRFAFIRDHVPGDWLETTADDMLRFLSLEDLNRVIGLIDELPPGNPKNDMYRLAAQRMHRLGTSREEIEDWIGTLENEDERESAGFVLRFEAP